MNARFNTQGLPMAGAAYSVTDRLDVRLLAGYFQRESWDYKVSLCAPPLDCWPERVRYSVHEYGAALAGRYDVTGWRMITLQGGAEVGYVLAHAPDRPSFATDGERADAVSALDKLNGRLSVSLIADVSARPLPWLAVFLEAGVGYDRGMPRRDDHTPRFLIRERAWGLTHLGPGLRVSL